jgi:AhpD family alkylhydroperoxidase
VTSWTFQLFDARLGSTSSRVGGETTLVARSSTSVAKRSLNPAANPATADGALGGRHPLVAAIVASAARIGPTLRVHALGTPTRALRRAIPDVYNGYRELHDAALSPGALDTRTKELIALAIAVSKECDGCIAAHAHAAVRHGATPAEAAEAIGVTFLMNGGPASVYGARAFDAFEEFYEQRSKAPAV